MLERARLVLYLIPALFFTGCIGTDFLEETVDLADPFIALIPEVEAIEVGEEIRFEASYFDSTGMPASASFEWASSDESVVQVSSEGIATGVGTGQVRVSASARGVSSEALLTVLSDPAAVALVTVEPGMVSVNEGEEVTFTATVTNGQGDVLTDRTVTWRTTIDTLATVDNAGTVRALKAGLVQVIATVDGIESVPAELEILATSRTGTFRKTPGSSYTVSGMAVLEQADSGDLVLRFLDDFTVSNGPDLFVYLSTESRVNGSSLSLGRLQANRGAQTYTIASNVAINDFDFVIIHCLPFNVSFGHAPLN